MKYKALLRSHFEYGQVGFHNKMKVIEFLEQDEIGKCYGEIPITT